MNFQNLEIEPINKIGALEVGKYGTRAEQLRELFNIGLPIPDGFLIPILSVNERHNLDEFQLSRNFDDLEGLYSLRCSVLDNTWGGVNAILNLGMNDELVNHLVPVLGKKSALAIYRRFIQNFGTAVYGLEPDLFENLVHEHVRSSKVLDDNQLEESSLSQIVDDSKNEFERWTGLRFPQNLSDQIDLAFDFLCREWTRPSAVILRQTRGAPEDAGLGVVLQKMVLGLGSDFSGSGQIKSIIKDTGESSLHGYFLPNSQGKDVLLGTRIPNVLSEDQRISEGQSIQSLEAMHSDSFERIKKMVRKASVEMGETFNFDFTIQANKLYILGATIAERSPRASVRIAVDLVGIGALREEEALLKVEPYNLIEFLHPQLNPGVQRDVFGNGLPASPGAVSGRIVFSSQSASALKAKGEAAILVRLETSPEDISGIHDSAGVMTVRGGMTSHAAVIARGLGLPCVVGVNSVNINLSEKTLTSRDGRKFLEGEKITLDGTRGQVLGGSAEMVQPVISGAFSKLMDWADKYRNIGVRANADSPQEALLARNFGADGIGLCRTEHMFFEKQKLLVMREMILADTEETRSESLKKLLPMQREDFIKFFQIMDGMPVTIRLLDPPLHEFLPHSEEEMAILAKSMNLPLKKIVDRSREIQEFNPMLGKRGVRLGVTLPEIYDMQVRAIFEAVSYVNKKSSYTVVPEIMIPLVSTNREVELIKSRIKTICDEIQIELSCELVYKLGVVVETPRAALCAKELSQSCDFLSFGTNDLTQMTYGLSRDDAGRFMRVYLEKEVFPKDPFRSLDFEGVGELMLMATKRARKENPEIELGLCGEHGGDPSSVKFCKSVNFDYVSCSPYRIPIARLAAAQASILGKNSK